MADNNNNTHNPSKTPYPAHPMKIRSRAKSTSHLCQRIVDTDTLKKQHCETLDEWKKLIEKEKNRRFELEEEAKRLKEETKRLKEEGKILKNKLESQQLHAAKALPVDLNNLITSFNRLADRFAESPQSLCKTDREMLTTLKPAVAFVDKAIECGIWNSTPQHNRKPDTLTRSTECENVYLQQTQTQNDVGTMYPEPMECSKVYEILKEMDEWNIVPISPLPASTTRKNDEPKKSGISTSAENIKRSPSHMRSINKHHKQTSPSLQGLTGIEYKENESKDNKDKNIHSVGS